jgi:hypothetical protein
LDELAFADRNARPSTRRRLLQAIAACLLSTSCADLRFRTERTPDSVTLADFMRLSRALTAMEDLGDDRTAELFLSGLLADPVSARRLSRLLIAAGFRSARPATSVAEMTEHGVYADPELGALADAITRHWYTGVDATAAGEPIVATYGDALAWRTLGYRPIGPSFCGGAFGHWSEPPIVV